MMGGSPPPATNTRAVKAHVASRGDGQEGGDESAPPVLAAETTARVVSQTKPKVRSIVKLAKFLRAKKISEDDFLMKIGANRVFGDARIDRSTFVKGLSAFNGAFSKQEANEIFDDVNIDGDKFVDVNELCAQVTGASAVEKFKAKLKTRGGLNGIRSISRTLRIMDDSGDKSLSRAELISGCKDIGLKLSTKDVNELFAHFDKDNSGKINFDEFLVGLRDPMSARRVALVERAYSILDATGDSKVTIEDIEAHYDPSFHPDVKSGKKTPRDVMTEFLRQWDTIEKDGVVTFDEFLNYYNGVSASVDDDAYFELMMRNAWRISGGKGQCANTANRRVLVTHKDGRQTVEEVKNDFGVRGEKAIVDRLPFKRYRQHQGCRVHVRH